MAYGRLNFRKGFMILHPIVYRSFIYWTYFMVIIGIDNSPYTILYME